MGKTAKMYAELAGVPGHIALHEVCQGNGNRRQTVNITNLGS